MVVSVVVEAVVVVVVFAVSVVCCTVLLGKAPAVVRVVDKAPAVDVDKAVENEDKEESGDIDDSESEAPNEVVARVAGCGTVSLVTSLFSARFFFNLEAHR